MYFVIIISILLPIVVAALIWLWLLMARQAKDDASLSKAQRILEKARQKSTDLVTEATEQSKKILDDTKFFAEEAQHDLDKALQKSIDRITKNNEEHINKILHHYNEVANQVNEDARKMAEEKITSFAGELQNTIKTTTAQMDQITSQELKDMRQRLAEFEQAKKADMEEELNTQVAKLVKKITSKAIPSAAHEKLVKEALDKAKGDIWS